MPKRKIFLLAFVLWLCFTWITTNAYQIFDLNIEETVNDWLQADFTLKNNFNFLTNGQYKIYQTKDWRFQWLYTLFWTNNGLYQISSVWNTDIRWQWYITTAKLYNELFDRANNWWPDLNLWENIEITAITQNTNFANPDRMIMYANYYELWLCFEYTNQTKTICTWKQFNNNDNSIWLTYNPYYYEIWTSLDLSNLQFMTTDSPFGSPNWWWNQTNNNTNINTLPLCPTIQQLINTYWNDYNINQCYSSSLIYTWWTIQQITPKTIFELYPQYTWYIADISTYNTYCRTPNTTTACQQAFEWKDIEYTLIAKIPDNVKKANLYQYCHLQLDYNDKQTTTCVWSWIMQTWSNSQWNIPITTEDIINSITNNSYTIILPWWVTETWWNTTWDSIYNDIVDLTSMNLRDSIDSLKRLYTKITWIFYRRNGVQWIIPNIITRWILLIVLFKIFRK